MRASKISCIQRCCKQDTLSSRALGIQIALKPEGFGVAFQANVFTLHNVGVLESEFKNTSISAM